MNLLYATLEARDFMECYDKEIMLVEIYPYEHDDTAISIYPTGFTIRSDLFDKTPIITQKEYLNRLDTLIDMAQALSKRGAEKEKSEGK